MRLIGALLAEKHESWSTGKRYFDMTEFHEWCEARQKKPNLTGSEFTAHLGLDLQARFAVDLLTEKVTPLFCRLS